MAHIHEVIDTDVHYKIDGITRAITNIDETKRTLAQNDHNSERLTFEIPRYIDGHDLTTCNRVEIHYINIDSTGKESNPGVYEVKDLGVLSDDENSVIFTWLITREVTKFAGTVNFIISFQCVNEAIIEYTWNTVIFKSLFVADGICNSQIIVEENADILEQWYKDFMDLIDRPRDILVTGVNNEVTNSPGSIVGGYNNTVKNSSGAIVGGGSTKIEDGNVAEEAGYSILQGLRNILKGTYSILFGRDNELHANGSIIAGARNILSKDAHFSAIFGVGHNVNNQYKFRAGRYSENNDDVFSIGIGGDDTKRKNAFSINKDGHVKVLKNLTIDGGLNVKGQIVNEDLSNKLNEIEESLPGFMYVMGGMGENAHVSGVVVKGNDWEFGDSWARDAIRTANNNIAGLRQSVNGFSITLGDIETVLDSIITMQNGLISGEEGGDYA